MIKQPARVVVETESSYQLETLPKSACPRCAEGKGCGGGILAQAFANRTYKISIDKRQSQLSINQLVQIGIHSTVLIRASILLYLFPLVFMIASASIAATIINNNDLVTVSASAIGFLLGIATTKKLSGFYINENLSSPILIEDENEGCWYQTD